MTKDDVIAADIRKAIADRVCAYCDTDCAGVAGALPSRCEGCVAAYATDAAYWLQSQRQQTARERQDVTTAYGEE